MKPFKDKIYWTLLPIGIVIGIFAVFVLPIKNTYALILPIVFWVVYYTWTYLDEKKRNR